MDCICFCLGGESYVHDVQAVREIMNYEEPTPVPGAPREVEGILNLRGEVVTVVSGRKVFGLDVGDRAGEGVRIVVLEVSGGWLGVSVDAVEEIVRLQHADVELSGQSVDSPYIKGTLMLDGQLLIVTDLTEIDIESGGYGPDGFFDG